MPKFACIFMKLVSRPHATSQPCLLHEVDLRTYCACLHLHKAFEHIQCSFLFLLVAHGSVSVCRHAQLSAGASLIRAEDGPRLSAFLAEWDESRRKSSIRSAQVSHVNTEIWNTVQQTARVSVASYEGSMSPTHTHRSFQRINGMIDMRGLRQIDTCSTFCRTSRLTAVDGSGSMYKGKRIC